jgi:hypothetical protein
MMITNRTCGWLCGLCVCGSEIKEPFECLLVLQKNLFMPIFDLLVGETFEKFTVHIYNAIRRRL